MCRGSDDVDDQAAPVLAALLAEIRDELARRAGVDPDTVAIGPVDFA